ncbi:MAG: DUF4174 domain-containing protein [Pseudomonadota bacterium]
MRDPATGFSKVAMAAALFLSGTTSATAFDAYAWQNRPLVISAPAETDPALAEQRAFLAAIREDLKERDMVVIEVVGDSVGALLGSAPALSSDAIRAATGLKPDRFGVALVGKDTGVKLRETRPVSGAQLFSLIDSMPMRRREMRNRGSDS